MNTLFDTHCHLNFSRFNSSVDEVIAAAREVGVETIVVPATNVETAHRALELAKKYDNIYVALGIHPHHIFEYVIEDKDTASVRSKQDLAEIERLLDTDRVVAVGEVGLDKHYYTNTRYAQYDISDAFINLQKEVLIQQIQLAVTYEKSLILHNREATAELIELLDQHFDKRLEGRSVLHCCEPLPELLAFTQAHNMYIGVDGDITYDPAKKEFVTLIQEDRLVLETDSPYLLPEPYRSRKEFPNTPSRLVDVCESVAAARGEEPGHVARYTTVNAMHLFGLTTKA